MGSKKSHRGAVWKRFDELAAMSESERCEVYRKNGVAFVSALVASAMSNGTVPELGSAEEFSGFIVELRDNYRRWNQRLMGLILALEAERQALNRQDLADFVATCPWIDLANAARNFLNSRRSR